MAKCIRVVGQGVPVRMSDDDAYQVVVRDGDGEYCPKSFWRDWYERDKPVGEGAVRSIARLVGSAITQVDTLAKNLQHKKPRR